MEMEDVRDTSPQWEELPSRIDRDYNMLLQSRTLGFYGERGRYGAYLQGAEDLLEHLLPALPTDLRSSLLATITLAKSKWKDS